MEGGINKTGNDNNWNNNGDEILITEQQLQDALYCYLTVFLSFHFNIERIFYIFVTSDTLFNLSYIFVFYFYSFIYFYPLPVKIFLLSREMTLG